MFQPIFFIGMSKNCFENLKINLEFLLNYKEFTNKEIQICIIDSDSVDGTKNYCTNLKIENKLNEFIEIDNLENLYNSRIERLAICRNEGLKYIDKHCNDKAVYIPMDMDLNLFKLMSLNEFEDLVNYFLDCDYDSIFPFSVPHYYDIFALRKAGWVNGNNLLKSKKLKDKFIFPSFLFNYFLIFSKQKHVDGFKEDLIGVESAFGGMGMYKLDIGLLKSAKYSTSDDEIDFHSEHLFFNNHFKNQAIFKKWKFDSPLEYTFFNSYSYLNKTIYILKTIKNDFKKLYKKFEYSE